MPLSRRELLRAAPAAALATSLSTRFAHARAPGDGMIVRMRQPMNLETPLADLTSNLTDNAKFYVRSHFNQPNIDLKKYTLSVEGHVEKHLELTLDDLKKMETVSREITLECGGNSRVFLIPQVRGLQWGNGAVGNAKWTGVALGAILERAKVKAGAVDVILVGADKGTITDPQSPGTIHFDRGIPLTKARKDECLLAWDMNDRPLPAIHGAPLRAIVGGWYGMASVKWLTRIIVTDRPHHAFWQTMEYSVWDRSGTLPQLVPLTQMQPKAILTSVGAHAVLPPGMIPLSGMAWAGEHAVAKVEISIDGGKKWTLARLTEKGRPFAWTAWKGEMKSGPSSIMVRCTDEKGRTQPATRDTDRRSYMINNLVPLEVSQQ